MRMRLRALAAGALVLATACGGGGTDTVRVQREVPVRPTPTPVPRLEHPITGVVFEGEQEWQGRPPLAVKVENSRAARPQAGLHDADLVYEELAEGGITRFIAVFHSRGSDRIGPVRSARMVDPEVIAPLAPLFGYSGGVPQVIAAVRRTQGITDLGYRSNPDLYRRISERRAPHNLYTNTETLWSGRSGGPPPPVFSFLSEGADPTEGGQPASGARFTFASNGEGIAYAYDADAGTWRRTQSGAPHTVEDGSQIAPVNVLFQFVPVRTGTIRDVSGTASPETDVIGQGEAILLRGGKVIRGSWTRASLGEPTRFLDASGQPMLLARGRTWVELLPAGQPVSVT